MVERNPHAEAVVRDMADTEEGSAYVQVYALLRIADEIGAVASALRALGTADAATRMGAIECLAMQVGRVADAITDRAESIED